MTDVSSHLELLRTGFEEDFAIAPPPMAPPPRITAGPGAIVDSSGSEAVIALTPEATAARYVQDDAAQLRDLMSRLADRWESEAELLDTSDTTQPQARVFKLCAEQLRAAAVTV